MKPWRRFLRFETDDSRHVPLSLRFSLNHEPEANSISLLFSHFATSFMRLFSWIHPSLDVPRQGFESGEQHDVWRLIGECALFA
jgi:hypothetical protein